MKRFFEKGSVVIPSIFIGMIVHPNGVEDQDDEKQMEEDEDDPPDPVSPDPVVPDDDRIEVKDEPVDPMSISDYEQPDPGSDYYEERNSDDFDVECESSDGEDPHSRPTYQPWDPEKTGYSTILSNSFSFVHFIFCF